MKRILAGFLCATMFLGLVGTPTTAYAQENTQIVNAAELSSSDEAGAGDEIITPDDEKEDAGSDNAGASGSQEVVPETKDTEDGKENPDQPGDGSSEAATEASSEASSDSSSDASSEDATTEEPGEASSEDVAGEEPTEDADTLVVDPDALEVIGADDTVTLMGSSDYIEIESISSNCFAVDKKGVLVLKDDCYLPVDAVIPAEAKIIPEGIFNDPKNGTDCTYVRFAKDSQLVEIEAGAFKGNTSIVKVELPKGITEIKDNTFMDCSSLKTITMAGNVTSIGSAAFQNTAITSIYSKSVKTVAANAFNSCKVLNNVNFSSLETIGNYAFSGCSKLSSGFNFSKTITTIGNGAFQGCGFTDLYLQDNTALTSLGNNVFQDNKSLTNVQFPGSYKAVPSKTFSGCSSLDTVVIGDGTIEIRNNAFENCEKLKNLTFTNTYKFANQAFAGCKSLAVITIRHNKAVDGNTVSIAEDAFPIKSGVTMKGFDLEVQDYAERRGYNFESLKTLHNIKVALTGLATVKPSVTSAAEGTEVSVKITPDSNYVLSSVTITQDTYVEITPSEIASNYQVFTFKMPEANVTIDVKMKSKSDAVTGIPKGDLVSLKGKNFSPDLDPVNNIYQFDTTGRECQLVVSDEKGITNAWLWNYASSNTKVATVNTNGVVRSIGQGKATITATLKTDKAKKAMVSVQVAGTSEITETVLPIINNGSKGGSSEEQTKINEQNEAAEAFRKSIAALRGTVTKETIELDGDKTMTIPVIQFEKHVIDYNAKTFNASIFAYAGTDPKSLTVTSNWSSTDKNIATVSQASSVTNKNTITVKKGAVGETLITVSVLNPGQKEADDVNTQSFIVRVIDATPRLENSTLNVDSNSTVGTPLDIVTVYDHKIAGDYLQLYAKAKDKSIIPCDDLQVYYKEGTFYIVSSHPDEPFAKTYSGATQLFLSGKFNKNDSGSFEIPITKLTVTKNALNPTIKTSGKINLFYNSTAPADLTGKVTVTQSIANIPVEDVKLVSAANYKKEGSEFPDTFDANFDIKKIDDKTFDITRTSAEMTKLNNKNVVSGYIYIYYRGYGSPVKKAITVPTYDTAPDYVLDVTTATASVYKSNQEYDLHLVDKKTKKTVQSLASLDDTVTPLGITGLGFTQATTDELFEDLDTASVKEAKKTNAITLKVKDAPFNGKAVIYVRMSTWSRALNYTFTLKTTNALPTVTFNTGTVTLNKTYASQTASITAKQNQPDAKLVGFDNITFKANAKQTPFYEALKSGITLTNDGIKVKLPEGSDIPKGTYTYTVTPLIKYNDGEEPIPARAISFKVSIVETNPTIKVGTTFKLNAVNPGTEVIKSAYTIGNLPTGVTGTLNQKNKKIEPAAANVPALSSIGNVEFKDGYATATLLDTTYVKANAGKSFKYKVSGLTVDCGNTNESPEIPAFYITLQLTNKAPTVSVKATGTINPIDANSKMTFTATVGNIETNITDISIYEIDVATDRAYERIGGSGSKGGKEYYSPHFNMQWPDKNKKVSYLEADDKERVNNGQKYKIKVIYKLEATGDKTYTSQFMITPKQTLPSIKTDKSAATLYAGQASKDRIVKVKVSTSTNMKVTFEKPVFASNTPAAVKKAFKIDSFDPATGEMTLKLTNPSALVLNSTYTLNFDTKYANQAPNTTGNRFALKVTVKK